MFGGHPKRANFLNEATQRRRVRPAAVTLVLLGGTFKRASRTLSETGITGSPTAVVCTVPPADRAAVVPEMHGSAQDMTAIRSYPLGKIAIR
jgi:hypothetical protein